MTIVLIEDGFVILLMYSPDCYNIIEWRLNTQTSLLYFRVCTL